MDMKILQLCFERILTCAKDFGSSECMGLMAVKPGGSTVSRALCLRRITVQPMVPMAIIGQNQIRNRSSIWCLK